MVGRPSLIVKTALAGCILMLLLSALPVASALYYVPPETIHRDVHAVCDIDGDGVEDVLENAFQIPEPGRYFRGGTQLFARSGATGDELWRADGVFYQAFRSDRGINYLRPGLPEPVGPRNVVPAGDVTGDGICDVYSWGLQGRLDSISTPLLGSPGSRSFDVLVRLIDGATGNTSWTQTFQGRQPHVNDWPWDLTANEVTLNFPTDFRVFTVGNETRLLLKTTDAVYDYVNDDFEVSRFYFDDPFYITNAATAEHYTVLDAQGDVIWTVDEQLQIDAQNTNLTWISGLSDVTGDGTPDILLDQMWLSNPRGTEMEYPESDDEVYKTGRGMRVLALAGDPGREGERLWITDIHDSLAVEPRADTEEGLEMLTWTHGRVLPDIDGDGIDDLVASWLGIEELAYASTDGKRRTHFLPVSGADGTILWDAVLQGWGFMHHLGGGLVAAATIDLPDAPGASEGFAAKGARVAALSGATGEQVWAREQASQGDGQASYHLGQWQWMHSFAPSDVDGDGTLDPVMTSKLQTALDKEQVFLSTARQSFDRIDGRTGEVLETYASWGPSGVFADCGDGIPTAFVGHSKRLDVVRWEGKADLFGGMIDASVRYPLMDSIEARSSLASIDLVSLGASCAATPSGVVVSTNMERFSFWRQFEIFPTMGLMTPAGMAWQAPGFEDEPMTPSLLEQAQFDSGRFVQSDWQLVASIAVAIIVGIGAGVVLSGPLRVARARARAKADPLGIMLVFLVIPGPAALGIFADDATDPPAVEVPDVIDQPPTPPGADASRPAATGQAPVDAEATGRKIVLPGGPAASLAAALSDPGARPIDIGNALHAMHGQPELDPRFDAEDTISFPHPVGDIDGDGVDDLAMDIFCLDRDGCREFSPGVLGGEEFIDWAVNGELCGPMHAVVMVSGASGEPLWSRDLVHRHERSVWLQEACEVEVIIGAVQTEAGDALLALKFEFWQPALWAETVFTHTLYLMDAGTGTTRWEAVFDGTMTNTFFDQVVADTMAVKPHLVHPSTGTPDLLGVGETQLLLQGIGFTLVEAHGWIAPPGLDKPPYVTDAYYADEWLARIDIETGEVLYKVDTLTPRPGRSILPWPSLTSPYLVDDYDYTWGYPYDVPEGHVAMVWDALDCCPDLDGDGIADLVTITREWRDIRNGLDQGDDGFGSSIYAWSGADGTPIFDTVLLDDVVADARVGRSNYQYRTEGLEVELRPAGDLDGDGRGDVLAHLRVHLSDYEDHVYAVSGTGAILWDRITPRFQEITVVGDVDEDGGNDIAHVQWWDRENKQRISGDGTNVTGRDVRFLRGATGDVLDRRAAIAAPYDVAAMFERVALGGLPDLDGDGVGDLPYDDPIFLPDQMTIHQLTWRSSRTGEALFTTDTAGALVMPSRLDDITGDGVDDIAYLIGDPNDLWIAFHDGASGDVLYSHRALPLAASSYAWVLPKIQFWTIDAGQATPGVMINIHMDVTKVVGEYRFYFMDEGEPVRELRMASYTQPQFLYYHAAGEGAGWSYPDGTPAGVHSLTYGPTPGTAKIIALRQEAEPTMGHIVADAARELWPIALSFIGALAVTTALLVYIPRRKA